jgi:hypothetical protein
VLERLQRGVKLLYSKAPAQNLTGATPWQLMLEHQRMQKAGTKLSLPMLNHSSNSSSRTSRLCRQPAVKLMGAIHSHHQRFHQ